MVGWVYMHMCECYQVQAYLLELSLDWSIVQLHVADPLRPQVFNC